MRLFRNYPYYVIAVIFSWFLTSCGNGKKIVYFNDIPDTLGFAKEVAKTEYIEPRIKSNDLLRVSIETVTPQSAASYGSSADGTISKGGNSGDGNSGYLVDKEGYFEMPMVGRLKVAGLTTSEARELIRAKASKYYVEPVVNVTYANFNITILGDVMSPGKKFINNEKVSIIDAISLATDLSGTGKRENIMLAREENGKQVFVRFNINSSNIFKSPYFYLQSGDIVYVEPNKGRAKALSADTSKDRYITLTASLLSIAIALASLLIRF